MMTITENQKKKSIRIAKEIIITIVQFLLYTYHL